MPVCLIPPTQPIKREKIFTLPQSYAMNRAQRVAIMDFARRYNEAYKEKGQHKGPITRAYMEVLQALVWGFANTKTGSCFPSYAALAARAGCCRDTAIEAVKVLESAGIIRVVTRLKRIGERVLRTSNAYVFRACGVGSEIPRGNQESKESVKSTAPVAPPVQLLEPKMSMIDAALAKFGLTAGLL